MSDASGVDRSTGMAVRVDTEPPFSSPPRRLCDDSVVGATAFGDAGVSFEHADAANVARTATAKVERERRRIIAILWSVTGGSC
jgi:hypothetical protein